MIYTKKDVLELVAEAVTALEERIGEDILDTCGDCDFEDLKAIASAQSASHFV